MIRRILSHLDRGARIHASILVAAMLVSALAEAAAIGLMFPLITLIQLPDQAQLPAFVIAISKLLGTTIHHELLIRLTFVVAGLYVFKNAFAAALALWQNRFVFDQQVKFSRRLMTRYVNAPYEFHLQRNSAEILNNLSSGSLLIFSQILAPAATIVVECLMIAIIGGVLFLLAPIASLLAVTVIGTAGIAFYLVIKHRIGRFGELQHQYLVQLMKTVNHAISGIREIKVAGTEAFYVDDYTRKNEGWSRSMCYLRVTTEMPRLFLETVMVVFVLAAVALVGVGDGSSSVVLPTIGLFAAAALRVLPSFNRIISANTSVRYYRPYFEAVASDLDQLPLVPAPPVPNEKVTFRDVIRVEEAHYTYPTRSHGALLGVSIAIRAGESVALVGPSGSGKTTLVNLILGLLEPSSGRVTVDGSDVREGLRGWQQQIGYVPQPVFIADDTLRRNVALGIPDAGIDDDSVWRSLEAAQLADFVREMSNGLETILGENGMSLSAGQRQRIGIARALYHDPSVLFLDEATAALDNTTEREINREVTRLAGRKTILAIAHRLSSVRSFDRILFMKDGCVISEGSWDEMIRSTPDFRSLVEAADLRRDPVEAEF